MIGPRRKLFACFTPFAGRTSRLRRRPWFVILRSLLRRIPFGPLEIDCLYFLEYLGLPPQNENLLRGPAEVRTATLSDMEGLTRCQNRPQAFLNRFKANDDCAVAVVDGRIVAYQWFCVRPAYVEERYGYRIEVPSDAIYEYDVFILPEYRLGGIWFKFHCLYLKEQMEKLRRRRIIGMVDYGNRVSMNTHLRFGFQLFRRVVVIRLFGKCLFLGRALSGDVTPRWASPAGSATANGARALGSSQRKTLVPAQSRASVTGE